MSRTSLPRRIASRVESTMMPAMTGARPLAASTVAATRSRYSSWSSVCPSPVEPPAAMPWLPAPISQSIWGATSLKSISPSFRNGVVIGGITPVGRAFMGWPSRFHPLIAGVSPLCRRYQPVAASLWDVGTAFQLRNWHGRVSETPREPALDQSGPGVRSSQYFIARTSTLADIAGLFLLTHDPRYLGRSEAAEISSNKRAIAPVVLERAQQFIAVIFDDACGFS